MRDSQIAKIVHAANRELRRLHGEEDSGDWDSFPVTRQEGIIEGVRRMREEPATTPEESHERWIKSMEAQGYSYGVHSVAEKTHPCMVPYGQLPEWQKQKDTLFGAIVRALS